MNVFTGSLMDCHVTISKNISPHFYFLNINNITSFLVIEK